MKKHAVLIALVVAMVSTTTTHSDAARIGVLAPIGMSENDVLRWSENVAQAEGKSVPFINANTIVIFDNITDMLMALRAGRIDRFNVGIYTAQYIATRNKDLALIDHHHNPILGLSLAMREEDKPKMQAVNLAISGMKSDGTLERLIRENIIVSGEPVAVDFPVIEGGEVMRVAVTGDLPPIDYVDPAGRPAGFNTAFLAELSRRTGRNIELVSVSAGTRQSAVSSGRVDAVMWTNNVYNMKRELLPYPLDKMMGLVISEPYLFQSRGAVERAK
ncbi:MAG: transporter substrate-binding domain-containing protein [Synergistaceae bacterium]|nr:transporter substrate-binding domain-containing protein [Synergistaceae bacterium]